MSSPRERWLDLPHSHVHIHTHTRTRARGERRPVRKCLFNKSSRVLSAADRHASWTRARSSVDREPLEATRLHPPPTYTIPLLPPCSRRYDITRGDRGHKSMAHPSTFYPGRRRRRERERFSRVSIPIYARARQPQIRSLSLALGGLYRDSNSDALSPRVLSAGGFVPMKDRAQRPGTFRIRRHRALSIYFTYTYIIIPSCRRETFSRRVGILIFFLLIFLWDGVLRAWRAKMMPLLISRTRERAWWRPVRCALWEVLRVMRVRAPRRYRAVR